MGGRAPTVPDLTAEEKAAVSQSVKSLSEILRPARERGAELEAPIAKLFAGFDLHRG